MNELEWSFVISCGEKSPRLKGGAVQGTLPDKTMQTRR
jgi:hypothetical protein